MAIVCAQEQEIGRRLRAGQLGSDDLLRELIRAARAGEDVGDRLDTLHTVLEAVGVVRGLKAFDQHGTTGDRGVHAVGIDRGLPSDPVYLCPEARCTRFWRPQGPAPVPRCAVSGDALHRERR